jgi:hypothetical protein
MKIWWTSSKLIFQVIKDSDGDKTIVRLLYAPKRTCRSFTRCPGLRKSPGIVVRVGEAEPVGPGGRLIGRSGASGSYAIASVAGNVVKPHVIRPYVTSSPSGQDVRISWGVTCSRGPTVRSTSGGWDDTTPVDDAAIPLPISSPDSRAVSVSAQLKSGGRSISLALYSADY